MLCFCECLFGLIALISWSVRTHSVFCIIVWFIDCNRVMRGWRLIVTRGSVCLQTHTTLIYTSGSWQLVFLDHLLTLPVYRAPLDRTPPQYIWTWKPSVTTGAHTYVMFNVISSSFWTSSCVSRGLIWEVNVSDILCFCDVSQGSVSRERLTSQFTSHGVWKGERRHICSVSLHKSWWILFVFVSHRFFLVWKWSLPTLRPKDH